MTVDSIQILLFTLAFIVPGYIIASTMATYAPYGKSDPNISFLRFLTMSAVHLTPWLVIGYVLLQADNAINPQTDQSVQSQLEEYFWNYPLWVAGFVVVALLISPLIIGYLAARADQSTRRSRLLDAFGLKTIHPAPSSWDRKFHEMLKQNKAAWMIVEFDDGSKAVGSYRPGSYASASPNERDVYLQDASLQDKAGEWIPLARTGNPPKQGGLLVPHGRIRSIEIHER